MTDRSRRAEARRRTAARFSIAYRPPDLLLTVYPPAGQGVQVGADEVRRALAALGATGRRDDAIDAAVERGDGVPVPVAVLAERTPALLSAVLVTVSPDGMTCEAAITDRFPWFEWTAEDVAAALRGAGVVHGLLPEGLAAAATPPYRPAVVARGEPPRAGQDARVEYAVPMTPLTRPAEDEQGRVDFKQLLVISQVRPGDLLALKVPAEPGLPGRDVYGREAPAPAPRDVPLVAGFNTRLDAEGRLVATAVGQPMARRDGIAVLPVFRVDGDVGSDTGNVRFEGTVVVGGSVRAGYAVKAGGDLVVRGNIEAARCIAGGSVRVTGGILGVVDAEGSVMARLIENATVSAGADVVAGAILHSQVRAAGRVVALAGRGRIVGGLVRAGTTVDARRLGSVAGTRTVVEAGLNAAVASRYESTERLGALVRKAESRLQARLAGRGADGPEARDRQALEAQLKVLRAQAESLGREMGRLEQARWSQNGRVTVRGTVYPGVVVKVAGLAWTATESVAGLILTAGEGEVRVRALR